MGVEGVVEKRKAESRVIEAGNELVERGEW